MAENLEINIEQGTTFEWIILVYGINKNPLDMAGYIGGSSGARGHIRKDYKSAEPSAIFNIRIANKSDIETLINNGDLHNISQTDLDGMQPDSAGKCYLVVTLAAAETSAINLSKGVYDIEVEDTYGYVFRAYQGQVTVSPEVTR